MNILISGSRHCYKKEVIFPAAGWMGGSSSARHHTLGITCSYQSAKKTDGPCRNGNDAFIAVNYTFILCLCIVNVWDKFIPYARFNKGCDVSISVRWINVDDCNQLSNGSSPEAPEHLIPLRSCSTTAVLCSASMQCNAYFGNCPWNKAELYLIYFQFWELIWSDWRGKSQLTIVKWQASTSTDYRYI